MIPSQILFALFMPTYLYLLDFEIEISIDKVIEIAHI